MAWELVFEQKFEDQNNPIEPILIPQSFDKFLLKTEFIAEESPQHWKIGGYLDHLIEDPPGSLIFFKSFKVYKESCLFSLEPLTNVYRIRFSPLRRYYWFTLKIWQFNE